MASSEKSFKDLQFAFASHIRNPDKVPAPDGVEDRRMAIYRDLFFSNIRNMLGNNFPVLRRLYGAERWSALVRDFFVRHQSHTPLFPELPREFLRFLEAHRGVDAGDPPFVLELAHYEWVELALQLDEAEFDDIRADPDGDLLEGSPVLSPLAWLLAYTWPVHRIRDDFQPATAPQRPTHLVVYRRRDDEVRFMEVNAVTARLIQLLEADVKQTGFAHVTALAEELGRDPQSLIEPASTILRDLRKREIVLGTAPGIA